MQKIKNCFNDLSFSVVLHPVFKKKKNIKGVMSSPNSLRRDIFLGQSSSSSVLENNNLSISFILFVCQMERVKKTKTKQKKKRK